MAANNCEPCSSCGQCYSTGSGNRSLSLPLFFGLSWLVLTFFYPPLFFVGLIYGGFKLAKKIIL